MEPRPQSAVRLRPKRRASASEPVVSRICVFTSVDGTLLDARTFEAGASGDAIQRLHAAGIPVIPVSVMTLEEIAPIAAKLELQQTMIIEAGGAIARWKNDRWDVEPCSPPAETLLDVITEIEDRSGANILVYSAMDESAASRVSGRSGDMLHASTHRCFSEPFVIESGDLETITRVAAEIGFSVRRGPRFFHLCRACDEGEAFARVREEMQCGLAIGLGGSVLDAEFLTRADVAIVVPGPDGVADPELLARLPDARVALAAGPAGWAAAVDEILQALATPRKRTRRVAS